MHLLRHYFFFFLFLLEFLWLKHNWKIEIKRKKWSTITLTVYCAAYVQIKKKRYFPWLLMFLWIIFHHQSLSYGHIVYSSDCKSLIVCVQTYFELFLFSFSKTANLFVFTLWFYVHTPYEMNQLFLLFFYLSSIFIISTCFMYVQSENEKQIPNRFILTLEHKT